MNETRIVELDETVGVEEQNTELVDRLTLVCACIMNMMCIAGIIGNSISFYIFTRPSFCGRSINILLAALSASDLITCILAVPVFSISQLQSLMPGTPMLTATVMLYFYPVTLMAQTMSVWMLVAITIDRYLAVCHPFIVRSYCTKSRAVITVAVIITFSIAYNFVRFWEFELNDDSEGGIEDMLKPLLRSNKMFMLLYQNLLTLLTQFLVPLVVLCCFNFEVTRTILKAGEQRRDLVASERREHSTAKMMLFVVLVFIFCYTFSFTLNVAEILNEELFRSPVGYLLNDVNNILIVLNSSSSFIFYCKYSSRYRSQLLKMCSLSFLLGRPCPHPGETKSTVVLSECSALVNNTTLTGPPPPGRQRSSGNLMIREASPRIVSPRNSSLHCAPRWSVADAGNMQRNINFKLQRESSLLVDREPL